MTAHEAADPALYPVNHLRNLGLDAVQTSHVLVVDVDFVPSRGLAEEIRAALGLRDKIRAQNVNAADPPEREAIVVPAFQRDLDKPCVASKDCPQNLREDSAFIPPDFASLRECVLEKHCTVFQGQDNWEGHHSTRSERWLSGDFYEEQPVVGATKEEEENGRQLRDMRRISCFDSLRYEPYVVLQWCRRPAATKGREEVPVEPAPFYDERFHGYGKNKIQYIQHLRFLSYQFAVLPQGFLVHNPHAPSPAKAVWTNVTSLSRLHQSMDALYPQFLQELADKYRQASWGNDMVQACGHHATQQLPS
jgi:hypothetical protein